MENNELNIMMGMIGVIIILIGSTMINDRLNNEDTLMGEIGFSNFSMSGSLLISNCSMEYYGLLFNMPELRNMTSQQRAGFTYGYVQGFMWEYERDETIPPLKIEIGNEECNNSYSKEYWDISDFTGEDECIEEGLCFIKYEYEIKRSED